MRDAKILLALGSIIREFATIRFAENDIDETEALLIMENVCSHFTRAAHNAMIGSMVRTKEEPPEADKAEAAEGKTELLKEFMERVGTEGSAIEATKAVPCADAAEEAEDADAQAES